MKIPGWILLTSLALNALLLCIGLQRWLSTQAQQSTHTSPGPSSGISLTSNTTANKAASSEAPNSTRAPSSSRPADENLWARLDSENVDILVKNLRAAGFPSRLIRSLILDLVQSRGEIARAAIQGKTPDLPYWKTAQYFPDDPVLKARIREINEAGNIVLSKYLFDPAIVQEEEFTAAYMRQRYGDLPAETLQSLLKIQKDYNELISDASKTLRNGADRQLTPDERSRIALLKAERDKDILSLLTPEQFEQYELRSSPTAETLRAKLNVFRPSEAEYKAIFRLQRDIDKRLNLDENSDAETKRAATEAMKALAPQIEAALGPGRYADYVQATKPGAGKINRLLIRLDLPLRTATQIDSVQADVSQRAKTIRDDSQLSPAERDLHLSALAQEAQTKLSNTLGGQRGLDAYSDIKGDWFRALQPKPVTP
jgi:hypothetical protein